MVDKSQGTPLRFEFDRTDSVQVTASEVRWEHSCLIVKRSEMSKGVAEQTCYSRYEAVL